MIFQFSVFHNNFNRSAGAYLPHAGYNNTVACGDTVAKGHSATIGKSADGDLTPFRLPITDNPDEITIVG